MLFRSFSSLSLSLCHSLLYPCPSLILFSISAICCSLFGIGTNNAHTDFPDGSRAVHFSDFNSSKKKIEEDGGSDIAAINRQQEALEKLPRLSPTYELREEIKKYKKDFRM